ncbi:hypothetical protein C8J30_1249 [Rhodobacter viridis]|uniref:Uncharacterized protein n=1 Tax=Rhodobacter viridis TaxID=1054202 RepID=A0A318TS22_9RHOB|nr:hypothetical protein [Rhodobacter viridis]PYF06727.1 hypothetical protein C8J30_1249 [Rhodobacter viridis]
MTFPPLTRSALALCVATLALAPSVTLAEIVAEPQLAKICLGAAAEKLGTRPGNLMTLPVERSRGKYTVNGQSDGGAVRMFSCTFDKHRKMTGLTIDGVAEAAAAADVGGAPRAALDKCLEMIGVPATIETVSALKPGFFEIILRESASKRRVACTVPGDGHETSDWVELN